MFECSPWVEPIQVSGHWLHHFDSVSINYTRVVSIFREILAPRKVVLWRLPLPIKYECIAARDGVK